jgi:hypothetical protein
MPSIDDVFTSNYLKADDIKGREPTVTIKSVEAKEFKGNNGAMQNKLVISFHGTKKIFVSNVTNSKRIAFMHGKDYTTWAGKKITLFVDPFIQFGNEIKPGIRVKPPSTPSLSPAQDVDEFEPTHNENTADDFGDEEIPF